MHAYYTKLSNRIETPKIKLLVVESYKDFLSLGESAHTRFDIEDEKRDIELEKQWQECNDLYLTFKNLVEK